jgi:protein tyrosine/serine phosphatase
MVLTQIYFIFSFSTGMLSMLLQSLVGVSDEDIVEDYYKSNIMRKTSAAAEGMRQRGKLDRAFFSGTNPEAMVTTLAFLRSKYGSVSPGYLDSIGFDQSWRQRLVQVLDIVPKSRL